MAKAAIQVFLQLSTIEAIARLCKDLNMSRSAWVSDAVEQCLAIALLEESQQAGRGKPAKSK